MEIGQALVTLGLAGGSFSDEDLQRSYRQGSRRTHPDLNPNDPEAGRKFQEVCTAYETLKGKATKVGATGKTEEGDLITDLGQGLGPLVNGKDCLTCKGKGYITEETHGWVRCTTCPGQGWYFPPCRRCNGTGKYKVNGVARGECRGCLGTGKWNKQVPCPTCNKEGVSNRPSRDPWGRYDIFGIFGDPRQARLGEVRTVEAHKFHTCQSCNGCGEVRIFNPALKKGILGR